MSTGNQDPYLLYRQNQVETADPLELVNILYAEAINTVNQCRKDFEIKDWTRVNAGLCKVQEILSELIGSLNAEAGEISVSFFSLYEYMHHLLVEANIKKDPAGLEQVEGMLISLKQAWQKASKQLREGAPQHLQEAQSG